MGLLVAHGLLEVDDLQICQSSMFNLLQRFDIKAKAPKLTKIIQIPLGRLLNCRLMLPTAWKGAVVTAVARRTSGRLEGNRPLDHVLVM